MSNPVAGEGPIICARPCPRGFTLVEMLVVIAVAAILAAIAIPSFQNSILANRGNTAGNQFVATLTMARAEAVKQGTYVEICPVASVTANGTCPTGAPTATDWSSGWYICCAPGTYSASNPAAKGIPVQQSTAALPAPMTAYGSYSAISFDAMGRAMAGGGFINSANFIFCPDGSTDTQSKGAVGVTIAMFGRVRVADVDKSTGVPYEEGDQTDMAACDNP